MHIKSLQLNNFRNYEKLEISFDRNTNILYGDNAQGKTNILEAVYLCGTSKSHRGNKDREMVRFGMEEAHIRMELEKKEIPSRIDMHLHKQRPKGIAINGVPIRKARELMGDINMGFFSPEDLNIIKNGPSERRRFMDIELCQLNGFYVNSLAGYNKTLNQRNRLLKDISFQPGLEKTLDIWDMQLLKYGKELIRERKSFLNELNETVKEVHSRLTGGQEEISVIYEPSSGENSFEADLLSGRERDLKLKMSGTGPHRDDFCVMVNGIDIRKYGSQGQQRTSALSLKLSEIYLVKNKIKDTPVLLLDDVLSELDSSRQNYLMDSIHDIQTIITCTGLDEFVSHQFEINKVFHIVQGKAFDI